MGCSNKYYRAKVVIRLHFPTQQMRNIAYTFVTGKEECKSRVFDNGKGEFMSFAGLPVVISYTS